jgi:hypothetical protein
MLRKSDELLEVKRLCSRISTYIINRASNDVNGKPVSNLEKVILIPLTTPGYNVPKSIPTKIKYVLLIRDQATSYTYFKFST